MESIDSRSMPLYIQLKPDRIGSSMESADVTLEPVDDPDLFGPCRCCNWVAWPAPPLPFPQPLLLRRTVGGDEGAGVAGDGCRAAVEDRHPTLQPRPAPPRRRGWGRMGSASSQYDPLSYALNFDEGHGQELHELLRLLSLVRRPASVDQVVRGPGQPRRGVPTAFSSVTTAGLRGVVGNSNPMRLEVLSKAALEVELRWWVHDQWCASDADANRCGRRTSQECSR